MAQRTKQQEVTSLSSSSKRKRVHEAEAEPAPAVRLIKKAKVYVTTTLGGPQPVESDKRQPATTSAALENHVPKEITKLIHDPRVLRAPKQHQHANDTATDNTITGANTSTAKKSGILLRTRQQKQADGADATAPSRTPSPGSQKRDGNGLILDPTFDYLLDKPRERNRHRGPDHAAMKRSCGYHQYENVRTKAEGELHGYRHKPILPINQRANAPPAFLGPKGALIQPAWVRDQDELADILWEEKIRRGEVSPGTIRPGRNKPICEAGRGFASQPKAGAAERNGQTRDPSEVLSRPQTAASSTANRGRTAASKRGTNSTASNVGGRKLKKRSTCIMAGSISNTKPSQSQGVTAVKKIVTSKARPKSSTSVPKTTKTSSKRKRTELEDHADDDNNDNYTEIAHAQVISARTVAAKRQKITVSSKMTKNDGLVATVEAQSSSRASAPKEAAIHLIDNKKGPRSQEFAHVPALSDPNQKGRAAPKAAKSKTDTKGPSMKPTTAQPATTSSSQPARRSERHKANKPSG